jgi:hypothetical protein
VQDIGPGDVVSCPPGIKHWHGAAPTGAMTHVAVTGSVDGKSVTWMEKVTDEQYTGSAAAPQGTDSRSLARPFKGPLFEVAPVINRYPARAHRAGGNRKLTLPHCNRFATRIDATCGIRWGFV